MFCSKINKEDAVEGKVIVDYKLDVDYELKRQDPDDRPLLKKTRKKTLCRICKCLQGTLRQFKMQHQVQDQIWHVHAA